MKHQAQASLLLAALVFGLIGVTKTAASDQRATVSSGNREIGFQEARAWRPDVKSARSYAKSRTGRVTFSVYDMKGRFHRFDGHHRVPMASTFKVMLLVAYLRQRTVAHRALVESDHRLLKPMIRRSDSNAATQVRDMLGRGPIEDLVRRARMRSFEWHSVWGLCRTTAQDQALFMRNLRRFLPERHRRYALRQLAQITPTQRWGIGAVRPPGWRIHFKGGWGSGSGAVDHQVALITRGRHRIGLAVTTEANGSHTYGKATLKGVFRRLVRGLPR